MQAGRAILCASDPSDPAGDGRMLWERLAEGAELRAQQALDVKEAEREWKDAAIWRKRGAELAGDALERVGREAPGGPRPAEVDTTETAVTPAQLEQLWRKYRAWRDRTQNPRASL